MHIFRTSLFLLIFNYISIVNSTYIETFEEETTEKPIKTLPWTVGEKILIGTAIGGTVLIAGAAGYVFITNTILQDDINQNIDFHRNNVTELAQNAMEQTKYVSSFSMNLLEKSINLEDILSSGYKILNNSINDITDLSIHINEATVAHLQNIIETADAYFVEASSQLLNISEVLTTHIKSIGNFTDNFSSLNNQIQNLTLSSWNQTINNYQYLCRQYVPVSFNGCDFLSPFAPFGSRYSENGFYPHFNSTAPHPYE